MKNRWKLAFFTLLVFVLIVLIVIFSFLFKPIEDDDIVYKQIDREKEDIPLELTTNKENLTNLIDLYINENHLNGPIDYSVKLTDQIELYGTMAVFTGSIDLKMTFEPQVLSNGDLILKQKTISLGTINLPVPYVLKFIRDSYKLPEWVKIQPNEESIYVALTEMKLKSGLSVHAKTFDLATDQISFMLYVSDKTVQP
ncbi:YpmS family protein [Bacillus spongiae]|uniref:YpmS family protein n=1 Tax=Bacillus spongiae TaxID=2683610 RepID=A0ABU8HDR4_9BACI